jgi:hypothetical protein
MNTDTHQITHIAEVKLAEKQNDGKYAYPIEALHTLKEPLSNDDPHLLTEQLTGPIFMKPPPMVRITKLWSTYVDKPTQTDDWEASPIKIWGLPSHPSSPEPPSPPTTENQ